MIKKDLGYDYPTDVRLVPGTPVHDKIVNNVVEMARYAHSVMSNRYDAWDAIDENLTAYVRLDDEEKKILEKDSRKPVSIVIPASFTVLETILTYLSAAFLENPILRYEGVEPSDAPGAAYLEALVDYQVRKAKVALHLHTIWRDALVYGFGVGVVGWESRTKRVTKKKMIQGMLAKVFTGISYQDVTEEVVDQTSTLFAIDPRRFLPDPNMPIMEVQRMSYVGWFDRDTYYSLRLAEADDPDLFNVRYLEHLVEGRSFLTRNLSIDYAVRHTEYSKPIDIIYMFAKIVPKDWGLSNSENVEKWFFAVAGDSVLLRAEPLDLDHDMFPIVITAPDYDGHSLTPTSRIEVLYGMQHTIDWLISSHITNVRKAINDMLVVDPFMINMNDLTNPQAGKIIRLRKSAWGRGVSGAVEQLKVSDVTRSHVEDAMFLTDNIRVTSAANDIVLGIMRRTGERRSATEAQSARDASLTRLEHIAKLISYQLMQDLGIMFASQTIQLMDRTLMDKIARRVAKRLAEEYGIKDVSPELLNIDYDVKVHDGTIPGGENGALWVQLFQALAGNPELAQQFDIPRIFKHIARVLGARSLPEFERKVNVETVGSPEQLQNMVQSGEIVPVQEIFNEQGGSNGEANVQL